MATESYMNGYIDGYITAMEKFKKESKKTLNAEDIAERYGVGINKAKSILRDIRRVCNGGKINDSKVLPAEADYWESLVDKQYKERL